MPPNSKAMTPHITCINYMCDLAERAPPDHTCNYECSLGASNVSHCETCCFGFPNFLLYKLQSSLQHGIYGDDDIAIFTAANKLQRCFSIVFCFYMRAWINLPGLS